MTPSPESLTRKSRIDPKLDARGWRRVKAPLASGACRTEEHETAHGPADYALFLDGKPVAIVEAKKMAVDAQNVLTQAERYARGLAARRILARFPVDFWARRFFWLRMPLDTS